jgi:large subunit ribosomal protein L10
MSDNLKIKEQQVADLQASIMSGTKAVFAVHYRGLPVSSVDDFRASLRDINVHVQVIKNTLSKRLFLGSEFEGVNAHLSGPVMLLFSQGEPQPVAKFLVGFIKKNKEVAVQCIAMGGGDVLLGSELPKVVSMLTKDQARAALLAVLKQPAQSLLRAVKHPSSSLGRVLGLAVRKQPSSS